MLAGFSWDYGGAVTSWKGGVLDKLWNTAANGHRRVFVQLAVDPRADAGLVAKVSGEAERRSDNSTLRKLTPRVREIAIEPR
jgi:hypothetical protein